MPFQDVWKTFQKRWSWATFILKSFSVFACLVNLILLESDSSKVMHSLVPLGEPVPPASHPISRSRWPSRNKEDDGLWWDSFRLYFLSPSFFPSFLWWGSTVKCWVLFRAKGGVHKIGKLSKIKGCSFCGACTLWWFFLHKRCWIHYYRCPVVHGLFVSQLPRLQK